MRYLYWVSLVLTIIGGLNWGLVGAFDYNLVFRLFKNREVVNVIYILVGLSSIYLGYHSFYNICGKSININVK